MKKLALCAAAAALALPSVSNAATVFAGSWFVGDGPEWTSNPAVLSAREAAALLFGGVAADYAISTIDNSVANINNLAHVDGWGDDQFLFATVGEDYKLDSGAPGYDDPSGGPSYSAYVLDHSCFNRYGNPGDACIDHAVGKNFAFRLDAGPGVPEPAAWALMITGFGLVGGAMRRRQSVSVTYA
jgi:hypothetical protein